MSRFIRAPDGWALDISLFAGDNVNCPTEMPVYGILRICASMVYKKIAVEDGGGMDSRGIKKGLRIALNP